MNIIIPMAGLGKRMRPHTLTTPKPLLPVMGKPIIETLISDIAGMIGEDVEEVSFITGHFGEEVENRLHQIAGNLGYRSAIYYQEDALGTAHALHCARESLKGKVLVAFADTLFKANFKIDTEEEAIIWTKQIEDPSLFGVVVTDARGYITRFAEKPKTFVSDHAIIGVYYFRDAAVLLQEIEYLIQNNIRGNNEFQLTDALENMRTKGMKIKDMTVDGWFDCGNKNATVETNREILKIHASENLISHDLKLNNSVIIKPSFIAEGVELNNSVIGPFVSVGKNTRIDNSVISNSIIMDYSTLKNVNIDNSIIGSHVKYSQKHQNLSIGDYTEIEQS